MKYASHVDETLFRSSRKSSKQLKTNKTRQAGQAIVQNHHPSQVKKKIVLGQTDLRRIRALATIQTTAELEQAELEREAQAEELRIKAKARKLHMLSRQAQAKARAPLTEMEQVFAAEKKKIVAHAQILQDEQHDSVKLMKTLGARAATFTIRDQQLAELATRGDEDLLYNEKMNLMMEKERLEDLKRREDLEDTKKAKRVADRQMIEHQIKERQAQLTAERTKVRVGHHPPLG